MTCPYGMNIYPSGREAEKDGNQTMAHPSLLDRICQKAHDGITTVKNDIFGFALGGTMALLVVGVGVTAVQVHKENQRIDNMIKSAPVALVEKAKLSYDSAFVHNADSLINHGMGQSEEVAVKNANTITWQKMAADMKKAGHRDSVDYYVARNQNDAIDKRCFDMVTTTETSTEFDAGGVYAMSHPAEMMNPMTTAGLPSGMVRKSTTSTDEVYKWGSLDSIRTSVKERQAKVASIDAAMLRKATQTR